MVDNCRVDSPVGFVNDIWESSIFVNLKDSFGQPFHPGPGTEARLVFSISMDSFNPFGNKTAKQKVSSTGIWLVLLNLPPSIRHLPENLYLAGIIPGPEKPSLTEINHYLQLIVDDFKCFWSSGFSLTRTFKHRLGRLLKGMIVPVVCDLLAAHQLIGHAAAPGAHYMCPLCDLDQDDINVLDRNEWPAKNIADVRKFALLWKEASSRADKEKLFEAFGWRWSPLFDLPYFDPTIFTVIDAMHAIDVGLLMFHCREVFQIDLKHQGGDGYATGPVESSEVVTVKEDSDRRKCIKLLRKNPPELLFKLLRYDRRVLYYICVFYDIKARGHSTIVGTRWILATNIFKWVR